MAMLNVLLIEDNHDDILLTRETLEKSRLIGKLEIVQDGEEACERVRCLGVKDRPDVILLDLYLPRRTGMEVMDEIKANLDLSQVPVVILTSSTADEDFIRMYNLRANACLSKPIDVQSFTKLAPTQPQAA